VKTNIFQLIENKRPFFATSRFQAGLDNPDKYIFCSKHKLTKNQTIKLSAIKGQWHSEDESTWMKKLLSLNKLQQNLRLLQQNPEYYFDDKIKEPRWLFVQVGDDYYVKEGINRTVLARFLAFYNSELFAKHCSYMGDNRIPAISGVDVIECQLDLENMQIVENIQQLLLTPKLKHLKLINTAPLMRPPEFKLFNSRLKQCQSLPISLEALSQLETQLQKTNILNRFVGDNLTRFIAS
jgi:hypothetical protein